MFENVGGEIKRIAKFFHGLGIAISIVLFLIIFVPALESESIIVMIPSFIVLVIGIVVSWLASLALYGFGQLIENSDIIAGRSSLGSLEETISNENTTHTSASKKAENDSKTFDQVVNESTLTPEQKAKVKELKGWYDEDLISITDCSRRIQEVLSEQPLDVRINIINKL